MNRNAAGIPNGMDQSEGRSGKQDGNSPLTATQDTPTGTIPSYIDI
jgi:hypothetical protein